MRQNKTHFDQHDQQSSKTRSQAGYTLMELLVVMAIIVVIMGAVAPRFIGQIGGAKAKTAAVQVENLSSAIEFFYLDTGRYPSTAEGLDALIAAPSNAQGWNGPYLRQGRLPDDPWKNPYIYQITSNGQFVIKSLGKDNKIGGDGENRDHVSGS